MDFAGFGEGLDEGFLLGLAIGGDGESGDLTEFGECCEARGDGVLLERTVGSGDAPEGARIFEGGVEVVILVYGQGNEV